ncbi:MAG: hypothetical protein MJ230_03180 [bacterium]|nr:hypothetical protein [bacterium]
MRINAVNNIQNYCSGVQHARHDKLKVSSTNTQTKTNNVNFIVFRGGNKDQALFYGVEVRPYFQKGGVSTIFDDMRNLKISENDPNFTNEQKGSKEYWNQKSKVFVSPIYNGKDVYNHETGNISSVQVDKIPDNLPADNPLSKYKGNYFMTNSAKFKNYTDTTAFLTENKLNVDKDIFILQDVTGGKRTMDFGSSNNTEIKLFRVMREFNGTNGKELSKTRDFLVFSDVAATWKAPYEGGGYASGEGNLIQNWKGEGDARSAKAFTELFERICEVAGEDGGKFCPGTVVLNDSQGAYAAENIAQKSAKGGEFWKGIKPLFITHNAGAGYIQKTTPLNMFMNIADRELIEAVKKDPDFVTALMHGENAVNGYFATKMPEIMADAQSAYSPFQNALYYAEKGYIPVVTVSPGYHKALITDPNLAPGAHEKLKKLAEKGDFVGILNAFENAGMDSFSKAGVGGYYSKDSIVYTFPQEAGTLANKTFESFSVMDRTKVNSENIDMEHIKEIKRQNRVKLLERFDKDVLDTLSNLKNVKGHENDYNLILAGLKNKDVNVYGYINKSIIESAKQSDTKVKVITSWGRGDAQKGLDSVLASFEKYILKHPEDANTVLVMGGALDLNKGNDEGKKIKTIIDRMNTNPKLQGRFVYLDGFAPNKPLAAGSDFSVFPSRFAPCELTDLESYKLLCRPIVTNCQGLAVKNFDPDIKAEKNRATGYKTKHAYDMPIEKLRTEVSAIDKVNEAEIKAGTKKSLRENLDNDLKKFMDMIKLDNQIKHGKDISDEEIFKIIKKDPGLHRKYEYEVLRPYRDAVIENELTDCLERALIRDNGKPVQDNMIRNLFNAKTDWENNAALNGGKSSGSSYRELFHRDGVEIKEDETLLYKVKQNCKDIIEKAKQGNIESKTSTTVGGNSEAKGNKWLMIGSIVLGVLGLGYGIISASKSHKAKAIQAEQTAQFDEPELAEIYDEEEV